MNAPRLYLLDVEGTVAPISLVTEVLFPYARERLSAFLSEHAADASVQGDLALLAVENRGESDSNCPQILGAPGPSVGTWDNTNRSQADALAYLNWLMDHDRKSTALKSLQGKIWKAGFESGELKGMLFADVPAALTRWSAEGRVAIYSSGSVEAQGLLFRHSNYGDLTPLIAAYFDTRTGPKTLPASYAAIAATMNVEPGEVLFFSDVVRELDAAREAGFRTRLVVRPGNAPVDNALVHALIHSFEEL